MATFVLVHGAFEGGWCWSRVARLLRNSGHEVLTPTLTGSGERFHLLSRDVSFSLYVEDIAAVFEHESIQDAILVGHSFGGAVITAVADRVPERVRQLVYLDAAAPSNGQAANGSFAAGTAEKLAELAASDGWLLPPLPVAAVGITEPADVELLNRLRHPHPIRTLAEPLSLRHGEPRQPKTYVVCTRKQALVQLFGVDPLQPFVERAQRERWRVMELALGHDAMLIDPPQVARVLESHA